MGFLFKLFFWKCMVYFVLTYKYEASAAKLRRNTSTDDINATTTNIVLEILGATFQVLNYSTTTVQSITWSEATLDICQVGFIYMKFNYKTQYCCHGKPSCIKPKTSGQQLCCSDKLPNGTTVTCCNTRQISIVLLKHAACCDVDFINADLEFCYNKIPYSKHDLTQTNHKSTGTLQTAEHSRNPYVFAANLILSICVVSLFVSFTTLVTLIITRRRYRTTYIKRTSKKGKRMKKYKLKTVETSFQNSKAENAFADEIEADGYESISDDKNLLVQKEDSRNLAYDNEKYKFNLSLANHTSNKSSQTENGKTINLSNVMGKHFDVRHVFDKNNRSLVLPHSSVKLTLSEEDASMGPECYASTFRNLNEIYKTFKRYLKDDEEIISPTVEYFLPENQRLKRFATAEMDYVYCGCTNSLSVWRFESDVERGVIIKKERIPNIQTLNAENAENADISYEIVSKSKIRIYLKHFCTLMCTVCHEKHECFTLTGHPYTVTLPSNGITKHVKVTLYILTGVSQLSDYEHNLEQIVDPNARRSVPKKINLPMRIQLEDYLDMHLDLWTDLIGTWKEKKIGTGLDDCEEVQLHNIAHCPKYRSDGSPFSREWHFECNLGEIDQLCNKVIFKGAFSITVINPHPGVDTTNPPPTKFVVCHEVDITDVEKHALAQAAGRGINSPIVDSSNTQNSFVRAETAFSR